MIRIAVCEFRQETNSFNPVVADMEYFIRGGIYRGKEMYDALYGKNCAVGGMFKAIEEAGGEPVPIYSMNANSGGPVDHAVLEHYLGVVIEGLKANMPLDGVFVSLHGATQTTVLDDACGEILSKIRQTVGENTVIAASCDLHANVTDLMQQKADYICGYNTYPHVDFFETGYRAAKLGLESLCDGRRPKMVRTVVPMIVPASSYTTLRGPFGELMGYGKSLVAKGDILDFSIFQMQPWLDVSKAGSSIITIAYDKDTADKYAVDLATRLFNIRDTFKTNLYSIDEVIAKAENNDSGKPIILVDAADSSNAGACGDSPAVVEHILKRNSPVKAAFYLNDANVVKTAFKIGVGNTSDVLFSGSKSCGHGTSVKAVATVRSLHDGYFIQEGPAGKGMLNNIGKTSVISIRNIDIVVCEGISAPGDPQLYRHFGIEPKFYQLVVVKACTSFRAAYESFAQEICETDTPGAAPINLKRLRFVRLPVSFFPFSDIGDYSIPTPVCFR